MATTDSSSPSQPQEVNCMVIADFHKQPWAATLGSMSSGDLVSGTALGVGSAALGAVAATAVVLGLPVAGTIQGYNSAGVLGALGGLTVGSIVGVLAGATLAVTGALFCVFQITAGVLRTPVTVWGHLSGRDWDADAQEWVYYDLKMDADKTLSMSDDQFQVALQTLGSTPAIFSSSTSIENIQEKTSSYSPGGSSRRAVSDTELYDVLGVQPHASANEIKKAYYVKARQHHPDRNQGDPDAHKLFQKIGAAYQVLSDENLRAAYDKRGKEVMENQSMIDASALYALFFGSEQFESVIGELQVATQAKALMEHGISNLPVELLQFKQRKREVHLAVTLAKKLDVYVDGDVDLFIEKAKSDAVTLSETTLGSALLGVIGQAYINAASSEASTIEGFWTWWVSTWGAVIDGFNSVAAGIGAASKALELQELQSADKKKDDEDPSRSKFGRSSLAQGFGPGPNATEQEIQKFRDTTKDMSIQLLNLFWLIVKFDINSTLLSVCKKVLRDHSVGAATKQRRIEGMLLLGKEFIARGTSSEAGINDLITRIGPQTGLFGDTSKPPNGTPNPPMGPSSGEESGQPSEGSVDYTDDDTLTNLLRNVSEMNTKDIKTHIAALGGTSSDCIEKRDLQQRLRQLLLLKLPTEDLMKIGEVVIRMKGLQIDVESCDRAKIIDIILAAEV